MRAFLTTTIAASLVLAASSVSAQPPGLQKANGGFATGEGKQLYSFENDPAGKSTCTGGCLNFWPPLAPGADAKPDADWTVITRDDGAKQWAYKGKPVYLFSRDMPGRPPMGESVQNWKMIR